MAKQTSPVKCPACGKEAPFTFFHTVSATDPESEKAVMDLSAFRFKCPVCGKSFPVVYPMLYTADSLVICLVENSKQLAALNQNIQGAGGKKLRAALSPDRLREKILIFKSGLDDRPMAILELAMKRELESHKVQAEEILFTGLDTTGDIKEMLFHVVQKNGSARKASWPMAIYEKVCEEFTAALPEEEKYILFDEDWAKDFMLH